MSDSILTLCLFPFPDGPLWTIAETRVSSIDDLDELGADACESNTTIETHPENEPDHALRRARQIGRDRALPLYKLVVNNPNDPPDTLDLIDHHLR